MTIMIQQQELLKAINMARELIKSEQINIRCTPKEKEMFRRNGGSVFFIKMLEQVDKERKEQKQRKPLTSGKN